VGIVGRSPGYFVLEISKEKLPLGLLFVSAENGGK
jgi:hypothetical protein